MCGFGFMAYGFECCHRSIDFSLMPYIGQPKTKIKVKCKALKKSELKRQNKQFVKRLCLYACELFEANNRRERKKRAYV
ncbi:uncharacterized protein [Drosophila takahashii]|uniref:uncharacterized protein n=1 Tax=Drosophila takahashii TaxID=29030 RepID=UPI003898F4FB